MALRSRIWSPMATPILGRGWEEGEMVSTGKASAASAHLPGTSNYVRAHRFPKDGPRRGTEELDPRHWTPAPCAPPNGLQCLQ